MGADASLQWPAAPVQRGIHAPVERLVGRIEQVDRRARPGQPILETKHMVGVEAGAKAGRAKLDIILEEQVQPLRPGLRAIVEPCIDDHPDVARRRPTIGEAGA